MSSEPWMGDDSWMNNDICDFCKKDYEDTNIDKFIIELAYSGDQPPVHVCGSCLVEGTIEWVNGDFNNFEDAEVAERVMMEIYSRGLDIKVHKESREDSLEMGEIPD